MGGREQVGVKESDTCERPINGLCAELVICTGRESGEECQECEEFIEKKCSQ